MPSLLQVQSYGYTAKIAYLEYWVQLLFMYTWWMYTKCRSGLPTML